MEAFLFFFKKSNAALSWITVSITFKSQGINMDSN